jgi:hypothetical protein
MEDLDYKTGGRVELNMWGRNVAAITSRQSPLSLFGDKDESTMLTAILSTHKNPS